ncbi:hypothetical protein IEQ34_011262 [Dendrobium chrysotoxum]|uniref:Uncharacterized protein n=1 Tax=Dendrobium chrysotoxum TaxID=161865 RepID=A0AAV7GXS5_DENCH|nr:hypothetical protein IEQ34_011262 [Dendrobium chrysotoxum]
MMDWTVKRKISGGRLILRSLGISFALQVHCSISDVVCISFSSKTDAGSIYQVGVGMQDSDAVQG